jgi:hypothetical protein
VLQRFAERTHLEHVGVDVDEMLDAVLIDCRLAFGVLGGWLRHLATTCSRASSGGSANRTCSVIIHRLLCEPLLPLALDYRLVRRNVCKQKATPTSPLV